MNKITSLVLITAVLMVGSINANAGFFGGNSCQGNCPDGDVINNTTNNQGGAGGKGGIGIGVGIGKGGDASSKSKSSSSSSAAAASSSRSSVTGTQLQGQVGIVKNVGPAVVITDESVTTYEAQDRDPVSSAYSHASHRYECVVGVGGGVQAANLGVSISGGYESSLCNMGFVAKFLRDGDPRLSALIDAMVDAVMPAPAVDATTYTVRD
jgi:hypothetical protein